MKLTTLRRHTPNGRVRLAHAIARNFEEELCDLRGVETNARKSLSPLTDLVYDGMLLTRLAAAFDGYDFEFDEEHEPLAYGFDVHLLAAAICTLRLDDHDLDQAIEDAKTLIRKRLDDEDRIIGNEHGMTMRSGGMIIRTMGLENIRKL